MQGMTILDTVYGTVLDIYAAQGPGGGGDSPRDGGEEGGEPGGLVQPGV